MGVVRQSREIHILDSVQVDSKEVKINMLQCANYTFFYCKAITQNIMVMKSILGCFELVFELKVNYLKSLFS